uniref:Ferredoxin oxidoreductase a-subunit n=1 Tax=Frankia sp. (strain EuIK1) TaxID=47227 RepID=Q9Z5X4_FRASE|nr:ferredoxin oxidoreductase a-subunit [Frankia sp. EuIK1]
MIRFAGDSGDGMQLTGDRFGAQARGGRQRRGHAAGLPGPTSGRQPAPSAASRATSCTSPTTTSPPLVTSPTFLVAMNPAALKATLKDLRPGGVLIVDSGGVQRALAGEGRLRLRPADPTARWATTIVHAVDLTGLAVGATEGLGLKRKDAARTKNMFALGLVSWMFNQGTESTVAYLEKPFAKKPPEKPFAKKPPEILTGNLAALRGRGELRRHHRAFASPTSEPAALPPGTYRNMRGNRATRSVSSPPRHQAGMPLFLGAYPITPATDVLHELSKLTSHDVRHSRPRTRSRRSARRSAARSPACWASPSTSGARHGAQVPRRSACDLAGSCRWFIVNVQRGGPSTGLPTKTEQSDLLQALYGRHGEAPLPVLAGESPADCFDAAFEAAQMRAGGRRTPVILLSDSYIANGSEPWKVPSVEELPDLGIEFATKPNAVGKDGTPKFHPYARDPRTLARPLAIPGTPGLEHRHRWPGEGRRQRRALARPGQPRPDGPHPPEQGRRRQGAAAGGRRPERGARLRRPGAGDRLGLDLRADRRRLPARPRPGAGHRPGAPALPQPAAGEPRGRAVVLRHGAGAEMNLGQLGGLLRMHCGAEVVGYTQTRGLPFRAVELAAVFTRLVHGADLGDTEITSEDIRAAGGASTLGMSELGRSELGKDLGKDLGENKEAGK